jgi:hypothetical protein
MDNWYFGSIYTSLIYTYPKKFKLLGLLESFQGGFCNQRECFGSYPFHKKKKMLSLSGIGSQHESQTV